MTEGSGKREKGSDPHITHKLHKKAASVKMERLYKNVLKYLMKRLQNDLYMYVHVVFKHCTNYGIPC